MENNISLSLQQLLNVFTNEYPDEQPSVELYNTYLKQNEYLKKQLENKTTILFTNDRKTYYQNQNYDNLIIWRKRLFFIFYLLIGIYVIYYYYYLNQNYFMSDYIKFALILAYSILFFFLPYIVIYSMKCVFYLYNLFPKNVYVSNF
jgi:hypothetical protein